MTNTYKQIQLTNTAIGDVAADAYVPLGRVTARINAPYNCCNTFAVSSSTADTVVINTAGFYKITYSLTATAADAGDITIALVVDGAPVYSVTQSYVAASTGANLTVVYTIRVASNGGAESNPVSVQLQNTGIALTGATSNLIIEKF